MCRDVGWEPIDAIVRRLVEGLSVDAGRTASTDTAQGRQGVASRAHDARGEDGAVILNFIPRKGPGTEAPGQVVWEDDNHTARDHETIATITARKAPRLASG